MQQQHYINPKVIRGSLLKSGSVGQEQSGSCAVLVGSFLVFLLLFTLTEERVTAKSSDALKKYIYIYMLLCTSKVFPALGFKHVILYRDTKENQCIETLSSFSESGLFSAFWPLMLSCLSGLVWWQDLQNCWLTASNLSGVLFDDSDAGEFFLSQRGSL